MPRSGFAMLFPGLMVSMIVFGGPACLAGSLPQGVAVGFTGTSAVSSPAATSVTLSENGIGPSTLSLTWSESGDLLFVSYTVQYSLTGSNGPYAVLSTITSIGDTSEYVYGLSPDTTYWWQIIDTDSLGSATSNTFQVTQPSVATLAYTLPTSTSVQFTWNNLASYGGLVEFGSYVLMESVASGAFSSATTITSSTTQGYTLNGLSPSTQYSFYLQTTDQCYGCSPPMPSSTDSNTVSFLTSAPLSASATGTPSAVDVGQKVTFSCAAGGGVPSYSYAWTFGDGTTGSGQTPTHSYAQSGTVTATCTVTDSKGSTATGATSVTVSALPTVTVPGASSNPILQGNSVTFSVTTTPGSGGLSYAWSGLPAGCSTTNAATLTCTPTATGSFAINVTVVDSNGGSATSYSLSFTVNPSFVGLPAAEGFELVAGILAAALLVVVMVVFVVVLRRRKKSDSRRPDLVRTYQPQSPPPPRGSS